VGNGALLFVAGAFTLWLVARGYGKNLGTAWNTLTGAGGGSQLQPPGPTDNPVGQPMTPVDPSSPTYVPGFASYEGPSIAA
jgi:hypothetical protein